MAEYSERKASLSLVLSRIVPHTSASSFEPEQLVDSCNLKELKANIHSGKVDPKTWHDAGSGRGLLHYAAASNQVETVQFLIADCRASPNSQEGEGNTPLHLAVIAGHVEATGAILAHRADDTLKNIRQDPPLHAAIKQNSEQGNKLVSEFTKHAHVSLFVRGYHDYSSLHIIAEKNNLRALKELYRAVEERDEIMMRPHLLARDRNGLTVFHIAARVGSHEVLEFLLCKSSISPAELEASLSHDGRNPFHYAIERGHADCAEVLLKYGADPVVVSEFHPPPLHLACSHGKLGILRAIVEARGKDVLQARDQEGGTALHSSTSSIFSRELISYLVEKEIGIDDVDSNLCSPLCNAIQLGSLNAVDELLKWGADPLLKDKWGSNSLHRAVLGKRMEIFKKLVSCDTAIIMATSADNRGHCPIHDALKLGLNEMVVALLDVTEQEFKDAEGNNYMHLAASSGDEKTLAHLLSKPCTHHMINEANALGFTPLHFAALGSSVTMVKKLLDYGAVIHKNNDGHTPLMCACYMGNLAAVELLYGSNKFQRDWVDLCGCTSLHLAVDGRNPDVVTFCLDKGMVITFDDYQHTFFDKILNACNRKLAEAALSHKRWEECINVSCPDKPHPILRIIDRLPEVYGIVLDHCFTHCTLDPTYSDYWEEFNFKCLSVKREPATPEQVKHVVREREGVEMIDLEEFYDIHTQLHTESDVSQGQRLQVQQQLTPQGETPSRSIGRKVGKRKERSLAVVRKLLDTKQEAYLLHPVVSAFIAMKWIGFALLFQLGIMIIHFLLALFFSILVVSLGPPPQSLNNSLPISVPISHNQSDSDGLESDYDSISTGSEILLIITLILSVLNLLVFFLQAYIHGLDLVVDFFSSLQYWFNFVASFCILLFLLSVLISGLREALWNSAALGVFFAWFSFGSTLQLLNLFSIGIYITMLVRITKLIVKVLSILVSFLFAFAFAFYILVGTAGGLQYNSIGLSMYSNLHSLIAVTDYLGFASLEQTGGLRFNVLTFMLLVLLAVLVPIVAVNLLIGLAVGDIAVIQRDAKLSHLAVEVHSLASFDERIIPRRFREHVSKEVRRNYPNRTSRFGVKSLTNLFRLKSDAGNTPEDKGEQYLREELEAEKKRLGHHLDRLQQGVEQLAADQLAQAEGMKRLEALVTKLADAQGLQ